jgi:hypothetical protein
MPTPESQAFFVSKDDPKKLIDEVETFTNLAFADTMDHESEYLFYWSNITGKIDADYQIGGTRRRSDLKI